MRIRLNARRGSTQVQSHGEAPLATARMSIASNVNVEEALFRHNSWHLCVEVVEEVEPCSQVPSVGDRSVSRLHFVRVFAVANLV